MEERFTAESTADIEKFTDIIYKLLSAVWGINWGVFSDEDPTGNDPTQMTLPHITYNLASRRVAKDRGIKPIQFHAYPDPDHEGDNIILYRWWFDCKVEFCVYGRTRRDATRTMQRFEEFMETYKGYMKQQGVSEILFEEESKPSVSSEYRQNIPHRTVVYSVRIERITEVRSAHIKQVEALVSAELQEGTLPKDAPVASYVQRSPESEPSFMDVYNQYYSNK